MKRNVIHIPALLLTGLLICAVLLCGCTGNETKETPAKAASGTVLTIAGSTTVLPIAAQAAEVFMDSHPGYDLQVSGGGSGVGVQSAAEGTAMIGMSSRDLKAEEKEKYPDLVEHEIAVDGIAIITHKSNPIPSLTLAQVKGIYDGSIKNWNEVGGSDAVIVVIGRDSASGTREFFHESVMKKEDFVQTQLEKNSNGAVKQGVEQTPSAIGYVGLGYVDGAIHAVPIEIDGVAVTPSLETVKSKAYPVARPLLFLTKGEPTGITAEFFAFVDSEEGQQIVADEGFIPLTN